MNEHNNMELRAYLFIIRRWLWLVLLCLVLASVSAFLFSQQQMQIYETSSTVLLDNSKPTSDTQAYEQILATNRLISTYAELFNGDEAKQKVIEELGYEPYFLETFVTPQRDTILLDLRVESNVPEAAHFVANRLPQIIDEQQRARQAARYENASKTFNEQLDKVAYEITQAGEKIVQLESENGDPSEIERQKSNLTLQEKTYETLLKDLSVIKLAQVENSNLLSIVEVAKVPEKPIRPRTLLNTLLSAIVGAMVGLGAAFLVEYLDDTIKASTDLASMFGVGALAFIGHNESGKERFLLSQEDRWTPMAEAYRMLRTNIRFASVDEPLRSLIITSPTPKDGKSTTAANLAMVLAQQGLRVILVDADLHRPVQHEIFKMSKQVGLTTALLNREVAVNQYLQPVDQNLRLLPSGPLPPNPSELLGSQRMRELLNELQELADYVIIDSAPVLSVADTSLLANAASGVLLVVRANKTTFEPLYSTVEQLQSAKANLIGFVMNDVVRNRSGDGYYYYNSYYAISDDKSDDKSDSGTGSKKRVSPQPTSWASWLLSLIPRQK